MPRWFWALALVAVGVLIYWQSTAPKGSEQVGTVQRLSPADLTIEQPLALNHVVASSDGRWLAATNVANNLVLIYDGQQLEQPLHIKKTSAVTLVRSTNLAIASDGQTVASAGAVPLVWLADDRILDLTPSLSPNERVLDFAFSSDGQQLAGLTSSNKIRIWQLDTGFQVQSMPSKSSVGLMAFRRNSSDGSGILLSRSAHEILLFDPQTATERTRFLGKHAAVTADGQTLAIIANDGTVSLCSLQAEKSDCAVVRPTYDKPLPEDDPEVLSRSFVPEDYASKMAVSFSNDGTLLADVQIDGTVSLWRVADRSLVQTFRHKQTDGLFFAPDDTTIITYNFFRAQFQLQPIVQRTS
jgi:WD40 repeat protein